MRVGKTLHDCLRSHELACRFGGEEFALLLRGVDGPDALRAVERVLDGIREIHVAVGEKDVAVAASAGLATVPPSGEAVGTKRLLELADLALYRAKAEGRDRVILVEADEGS